MLAQCAIDNAKRSFDIDIPNEISLIKKNIETYGFPMYWKQIKINNDKRHNHGKRKKLSPKQLNRFKESIKCPMNCVYDLDIDTKNYTKTLPNELFFVSQQPEINKRKNKRVEELIEKYSLEVYKYNTEEEYDNGEEFLLRTDFEELIKDIRNTYISGNYKGVMWWLLNRAFLLTPKMKENMSTIKTQLNKNRPLLLKTLYIVNKDAFLECFTRKID